jgi:repressor LexA
MPDKGQLSETELQALRYLRNAIVHGGHSPSVRDLARILEYKSPRTAFLILNKLIEKGWLKRKDGGELQLRKDLDVRRDHARTVEIPIVGSAACGTPILAEENIEAYMPVSVSLAKPGGQYFLLRASGDSMNQAGIENGDLVLVRQQPQADNGERIVALIDDAATIKEFRREKDVVVLQPRSTNPAHKPIVLSSNFIIQGVVVAAIPKTT